MSSTIPLEGDISTEASSAVIDVLLLSIIQAYPHDQKGRKEYARLNEAKSALFGVKSPRGPAVQDDLSELIHMTEAYIQERGQPTTGKDYELGWPDGDCQLHKPPTVLAKEAMRARRAVDPNYKPHSDNKADNLQEKFCRNKDEWLRMAYGQPGVAQSVFTLKVSELAELLEPLGVRIRMP